MEKLKAVQREKSNDKEQARQTYSDDRIWTDWKHKL